MFLYKQYCYETINDVANSIVSESLQTDGSFVASVDVFTSTVDINMQNRNQAWTYTYTPPACTQIGFDNSFFGVTSVDAVQVSWMSAAVLVAAWAIKTLKRGT